MKYSSTVRLINTVLFALLGSGFLFLGIWFGIVIAPYMIIQTGAKVDLPTDISYALICELGALGLAAGAVCVAGFLFSILSVLRGNDDRLVVKAFSCYISLGFVLAIFTLLNASWLYNLTSINYGYSDTGFVITVFAIASLLILIATCIPLVHMFQQEPTQNKTLKILAGVLAAADFALLLPQGLTFFVTKNAPLFAYQDNYTNKLGMICLVLIIGLVVSCAAYLLAERDDRAGVERKPTALLYTLALMLQGGAIMTAGILESNNYQAKTDQSIHSLLSQTIRGGYKYWRDFSIMSYVIAGLIFLVALVFIYYTLFPNRLKKVVTE